jgi:two-component system chemotaxis sensor kinase CheA
LALPDHIVSQFRTVAQERLERIEQAWALVMVSLDDEASNTLQREVHTLKGESRMLGFDDVNTVCHKLEDLLEVARGRGYAVDEDFDLTVNMALRFMTMLVRKKVGAQLGGIDLPGFIRQIDSVLAEMRTTAEQGMVRTRTGSIQPLTKGPTPTRIPNAVRERLAAVALDAFIEYAASSGPRRDRLRHSWHSLREMLGLQRAVIGSAQLLKLKSNVVALAKELGKQVDVTFSLASAEVTAEVLDAIDVAALHLARNAVDHGIETPAERIVAGKPPMGKLVLRGGIQSGRLVVELEDDGRGLQFDRVRSRAVELGMSKRIADSLDQDRLLELLCQPGFSTRTETTDISGRGVGLDAVKSTAQELGGTLSAVSTLGLGTTWTISMPVPHLNVEAHSLRAPGVPFPVLIDSSWKLLAPSATPNDPSVKTLDVAAQLGLPPGSSRGEPVTFERAGIRIAVLCDRAPVPALARHLIDTPDKSIGEVVLLDSVEALLLRPDRV